MPPFTVSKVCVLIAFMAFVLACFGVSPFGVNPIAFGLAFWCASELVP